MVFSLCVWNPCIWRIAWTAHYCMESRCRSMFGWQTTPFFLHLLHVASRALHFPRCGLCCPQYRHTSTVDLFRAGCSSMSVRNGAVVRPFDSNCCSDTLLISGVAGSIDVFFIKRTSRCVSSRARALSVTIFKSIFLAIISAGAFRTECVRTEWPLT